MQPEHLRDNEYNIALQDRYDELINASRDVWAESAAGGFAKRKIDAETTKPVLKQSPEKSHTMKEVTKKESSGNAIGGSIKKTVVKLNSMPNNGIPKGTLVSQMTEQKQQS